jgi:hypothetical protein
MNQEEFQSILEQHKLWLETRGEQGCCADLRGADLRGADLRGADLRDANLAGANLRLAYLCGANLHVVCLSGADLSGADLSGAELYGANLTDAELYGANLMGANLMGANLMGTYLRTESLKDAKSLPDISWFKSGCLVELNKIRRNFYLQKESRYDNFIQDSLGMIVQENLEDKTFDILVEDRIIRNVPNWLKYSGLKQITV